MPLSRCVEQNLPLSIMHAGEIKQNFNFLLLFFLNFVLEIVKCAALV